MANYAERAVTYELAGGGGRARETEGSTEVLLRSMFFCGEAGSDRRRG